MFQFTTFNNTDHVMEVKAFIQSIREGQELVETDTTRDLTSIYRTFEGQCHVC